jgi:hypothetical protein
MISAGVGCSGMVTEPSTQSVGNTNGSRAPDSGSNPTGGSTATTGTVDARVMVPGGVQLGALEFTLRNGTTPIAGDAHVADPSDVRFSIADVPAGAGYTLQVTGSSSDDTETCTGTSQVFSVIAQQATQVTVSAVCTGTDPLYGPPMHCPVWNTLVANPRIVPFPGGSSMLAASATSPDPVSMFAWSASAGSIHEVRQTATSSTAVFTCPATSGGTVIVTLVVTDPLYPDAGSCPAALGHGDVEVVCPPPIPQADGGVNGSEEAGPADDAAADAPGVGE